jgi:hypothetical protein
MDDCIMDGMVNGMAKEGNEGMRECFFIQVFHQLLFQKI